MKKAIEYRALQGIELRATDDGKPIIAGYAAVFGKRSLDLGGFVEEIAPGAFGKSLKAGADVRALVDHDLARIIGRNKAGTLAVDEDDTGLRVEITPPDTTTGRDVVESIKRGDLDGMSFGFYTVADEWRKENGMDVRVLKEADLFDVSVVTYPAYPDTSVALRSLELASRVRGTRSATARVRLARGE